MSALWLDIEVYADREADMLLRLAELNQEEEGAEEDLPPIIQDEIPVWYDWGEAA